MSLGPTYVGVDAGSTTVKAVALDPAGTLVAQHLCGVSGDYAADIARVLAALDGAGQAAAVVATGYAQDLVPGAGRTVSEISCHARGAGAQVPGAEALIDIGGQDLKVVKFSPQGKPLDFLMNDKCAAGTGRFLDVMARALGTDAAGLSALAQGAKGQVRISSMCTVFAESEVITLLSRGNPAGEIACALLNSIAERIYGMAARLTGTGRVVLCGGGALNQGLADALNRRLKCELVRPAFPQLNGALGAALTARDTVS